MNSLNLISLFRNVQVIRMLIENDGFASEILETWDKYR